MMARKTRRGIPSSVLLDVRVLSQRGVVGASIASNASMLVLLTLLLLTPFLFVTDAYQITPGTGLWSKKTNDQVVIFEHTDHGTGGLVLNCPTPLCIGQLPIPRFQPFKELPLMLGSGLERTTRTTTIASLNEDDEEDEVDQQGEEESNTIALGEVSPWFWLHDVEDIPGSFPLPGAKGKLYMGGSIEEAVKRLEEKNINPVGRFKFFRKYKVWPSGQLEKELERGEWVAMEQDPKQALEPIHLGLKLP